MKILELFCGTKSLSKVAKELGHETYTVDIEKKFNPDLCIDILKMQLTDLPEKWRTPDFVWASPPCTTFSVASLRHYWDNGKPKNDKCIKGIMIACKTIAIIKAMNPKYFVIENPRGMMRKQWFMKGLPRRTVTYCQYGDFRQKPTDLWTNLGLRWNPKPMCSPGDSCHESAQRGADKGTQSIGGGGKNGSILRAVVPRELCLEILNSAFQNNRNEVSK